MQQRFQDAVIQASDAMVMTHNRHVLHMGFEFWRDRINTFYTGNSGALGAIIFNGAFTSSDPTNATTPTGGYGGADFYLGLPAPYGKGISSGQWGQRANIFAGYIQDDWRATQNLTINLGLRYEAHTPWVEAHDLQVNFDLVTGQLLAPNCAKVNLGTAPMTCQQTERPWSLQGHLRRQELPAPDWLRLDPVTSWAAKRYCAALSVSRLIWKERERTCASPSIRLSPRLKHWCNTTIWHLPGTTTEQGLAPVGSASDPFAELWSGSGIPHVQPAITQQWNGTVQQQLGNNGTIQVGYVGQHGTHLMVPMPYLQRQLLPNSACATPPCTAPSYFFSGNPAFQSDISQISGTASVGSSNYHALQAVFQKRYSSGLQYQVAYTLSRCRTDNSGYYGNWGAQAAPANPYYQNLYDPKS